MMPIDFYRAVQGFEGLLSITNDTVDTWNGPEQNLIQTQLEWQWKK